MVLSNKKLKQKLRAAKAELVVSTDAESNLTRNSKDLKPHAPQSLITILNLETHKPILSKREKRRQKAQIEKPNVIEHGGMKDGADANEQNSSKSDAEEVKKKKKRKRDEGETSKDVKERNPQQMDKKKKNKKKKPKKKKAGNGKVNDKGVDHSENDVNVDQVAAKTNQDTERTAEVSEKIYVGGIPYYSNEDDIRTYFEGCGTITALDCMTFPDTGKFRGIAIITFKTEAAAKRALALDGSDMGGLFLKIQPFKSSKVKNNKSPAFSPSVVAGYNRIYVGNLSWDVTEEDLRNLFSDCTVESIRFGEDKETGEFKGYAHVDFGDSLSLNTALKLDQKTVCGRAVRISCAVPKKAKLTVPNEVQITAGNEVTIPSKVTASTEATNFVGAKVTETANAVSVKVTTNFFSSNVSGNSEATNGVSVKVTTNAVGSNVIGSSEATNVVSSKVRRRTCYECGERGHISSLCPKRERKEDDL